MTTAGPLLIPNLGAEETRDWSRFATHPAVVRTVALWRSLFTPGNELAGVEAPPPEWWPMSLGPRPTTAAFSWLATCTSAAWLADEDAHALAAGRGQPLTASPPGIVRRVHDKAFALAGARALDEEPQPLRGLCSILDPSELADPESALRQIETQLDAWPAWTRGRFTLKPRLGSSGRGRVGGERDAIDKDAICGALPRLADRGGLVLEPWLDRTRDLSVVLHLADSGHSGSAAITILGSLEQWVSNSGVYQGHLGEIDSRGRVFSGAPEDEAMRGAAVALAQRARAAGYAGPCGVDGFVFRMQDESDDAPRERLRPLVELNARFTVGIVVVGLVRRALATVKQSLGLSPGERLAFLFGLECPAHWADWEQGRHSLGDRSLLVPLAPESDPRGPALVICEDIERIRSALVAGRAG